MLRRFVIARRKTAMYSMITLARATKSTKGDFIDGTIVDADVVLVCQSGAIYRTFDDGTALKLDSQQC
jgi:hypothetical protein